MKQDSLPGMPIEAHSPPDQTHPEDRLLFEEMMADFPWGDKYIALLEEGWQWRKAAYIAWASTPKKYREPASLKAFADIIGCLPGTIRGWREKNRAIDLRVAKQAAGLVIERIPDVIDALLTSASNDSYKNAPDRRVALEMGMVYTPRSKIDLRDRSGLDDDDMSSKSPEELRRLASLGGEGDE